jgi:threonylcarbamoyladenosine tRNA methylthiotransferase MtaB
MATFFIENFGCRATEADASALRRELLGKGLAVSAGPECADFLVLNTCTVTAAADSQAREAIRKMHRSNPQAQIVVTGCYAQRAPEDLVAIEGVHYVVGNARQTEIPAIIDGLVGHAHVPRATDTPANLAPLIQSDPQALSLAPSPAKILRGDIFAQTVVQIAPASLLAGNRTRPILKVQDGCNNRCAYCVIPFVRGKSRSLPPENVIEQVRELANAGAREIVLSGINLGSYGRDLEPRVGLADIVRRILDETPIEHLRFSSIEPQDVTEDFVALVASSHRLAPHFHIPLQSGCDRILRAMHRWYRTELYAQRVCLIRRLLPDAAIGADVVVGFPGETAEDFENTVGFIDSLPFTYLHVFSFSARPGTEAAKLGDPVPLQVIGERSRRLRDLSAKKSTAFRRALAGSTLPALTLARTGDDWTEALTSNYLKVRIAGRLPANQWRLILLQSNPTELCTGPAGSAFENHMGQREVAAVGDGEENILHCETLRKFAGDSCKI